MNEFDIKAAGWDKNPMHWDRSYAIAKEIIKLIPLKKQMTALEYGAGTGVTSFMLKDYLKDLADFAGISTESTVKLLKIFEKEGLIELHEKDIKIVKQDALLEISRRG